MLRTEFRVLAALAIVICITSCTDVPKAPPNAADKSAQAAGPVSGKTAFWETYKSAHVWAADKVPLSLESKGVPSDGKAAVWVATFGSPRKHEARIFTYSASVQAPDLLKGVTVGRAISWGGPSGDALPFEAADFTVDSDAAYKTALAQADAWVKKHPDKQPTLVLGNAARFSAPVWYVLWGDRKSGYSVYVSAKTGEVVK